MPPECIAFWINKIRKIGWSINMKKSICFIISCILCLAFLAGCNDGAGGGSKDSDPANDAPVSTEYIAVIDGEKIYTTDFLYLFTTTVNNACRNDPDYPSYGTEQEKYDFLNTFLFREENGTTAFQKAIDDTLVQCKQLIALQAEAREKGALMTETQKKEFFDAINTQVNYNMAITSDASLDSRDKVCLYLTGMNVNEYKRFALMQKNVEDYASALMETYNPSEEELFAFYRENESDYITRTIRKIFISAAESEEGQEDTDSDARKKEAEEIYALVRNETYPMSVIAKGWSEESNVIETEGLYDVVATDTTLEPVLMEWAMNCTAPVGSKDAKFFDVEGIGYYIVTCESCHTYETSEVMQKAVLTGLRKKLLWEHADTLVASGMYELSEYSREAVEIVAKAFLNDKNPSK